MKTTIDISDNLFQKTKAQAFKLKLPFRAIVESALQLYFEVKSKDQKENKKYKRVTFGEGGLVPGIQENDWNKIRDISYGIKE